MVKVPLRVLITDPKLLDNEEFKERIEMLQKQGHTIEVSNGQLMAYDFICGPNCWYLNPNTYNLFVLALNNARKVANADPERQPVKKAKVKPSGKKKGKSKAMPTVQDTADTGEHI